jgi:hypothetical protein
VAASVMMRFIPLVLLAACVDIPGPHASERPIDAAPIDAPIDAAIDAPIDAPTDAGTEPCPAAQVLFDGFAVQEGQVFTSALRYITVDNGIIRVRYGGHVRDENDTGVTIEDLERPFDHVLAARHSDPPEVAENPDCQSGACHSNGAHWHDAQYPWYGDSSVYSANGDEGDADRVTVLRSDRDVVELSYEWDHVPFDRLDGPQDCAMGQWPECGPPSRDHEGEPVYVNGNQVKSIKHAHVWKTIRLERCTPGYYVSMRSDPPLVWPEQGERGPRLGTMSSSVVWSCDGEQVVRHPDNGGHFLFEGELNCLADLSPVQTGAEGWPFLRFMTTRVPTKWASLQFGTQYGTPGPIEVYDHTGRDGRPEPWQAFIGAVEYVSPDHAQEPTPAALQLVQQNMPASWPRD